MDVDKLTNAEPVSLSEVEEAERSQNVSSNPADDATMNEIETAEGSNNATNKKTVKGSAGKGVGKGKGAGNKGKGKANGNVNGSNGVGSSGSSVNVPPPTFPLARVSRIVKADPDIQMTSKDAIWTIAVATELFIKHLTDSLISKTKLEKKKIASYKELSAVVDTQEEFEFLQEVIPEPIQAQEAFQFRKELQEQNYQRAVGLIIDEDSDEEEEEEAAEEVEEEQIEGATENNAEEQTETADAVIQDIQPEEGQPKAKKSGKPKGTNAKSKKQGANAVADATDGSTTMEGDANTSVVSAGGRKKGANAGQGGSKSATKPLQPIDGDEEMQDL